MIIISVLLLLNTISQIIFTEALRTSSLLHLPILFSATANGFNLISFGSLSAWDYLRMMIEDT